jgi:hypothetical protein
LVRQQPGCPFGLCAPSVTILSQFPLAGFQFLDTFGQELVFGALQFKLCPYFRQLRSVSAVLWRIVSDTLWPHVAEQPLQFRYVDQAVARFGFFV